MKNGTKLSSASAAAGVDCAGRLDLTHLRHCRHERFESRGTGVGARRPGARSWRCGWAWTARASSGKAAREAWLVGRLSLSPLALAAMLSNVTLIVSCRACHDGDGAMQRSL